MHAVQDALAVGLRVVPGIFAVPEVVHLGAEVSVDPRDALLMQSQHQIGVLVAPAVECFIEAVDGGEVRIPERKVAGAYAFPAKPRFYTTRSPWPAQQV